MYSRKLADSVMSAVAIDLSMSSRLVKRREIACCPSIVCSSSSGIVPVVRRTRATSRYPSVQWSGSFGIGEVTAPYV